jgi:hypothetical protein
VTGQRTPSTFDLRVFAALLAPFCAVIGAWTGRLVELPRLGWWMGLAVAPVSVVGLLSPNKIRPLYHAWMAVTAPIGRGLSLLMLGVIYLGLVTPIGWCLRAFGTDPASRRWMPGAGSYWVDLPESPEDRFFHPF